MRDGRGPRDSRGRPKPTSRPPAPRSPRGPGGGRARDAGPGPRQWDRSPGGIPPGGIPPGGIPPGHRTAARSGRFGGSARAGMAGAARRAGLSRSNPYRRLRLGMLCVGFALSLVAVRLVQMQGLDWASYRADAQRLWIQRIRIPAQRGEITTADGTVLAMTIQTDTVTADPPQIEGTTRAATVALRQQVASALAGPLHMSAATIDHMLNHPTDPQYVLLASGVPATTGTRIADLMNHLNVGGIYLQPAYTRAYPNGDLASNLVGFTDVNGAGDMVGEAGIEESFNRLLAGRDGVQHVETGATGQPIPLAMDRVRPVIPGGNVRLTILSALQWKAQQACAADIRTFKASNCSVVVIQPATGRILALAQAPNFDPSHVTSLASTVDVPVADEFPPGSTAKVITVAAALEHGGQTPLSPYTVPYQLTMDGFTFHDADYHPVERLTLAGILAHSSNVGMVQVAHTISPQLQHDYLMNFGLGQPTGLPLPDATSGTVWPAGKWRTERDVQAFGQGLSVNAVQMASVYATIANGGVRVSPSIVAGTTGPGGHFHPAPAPHRQRVIQPATARSIIRMLQQVPYLDATLAAQPWGEIPGYSVASKTGTAQEGACQCVYGSSYIGMAPASDPQVVVAVNIQNPTRGGYYGNAVAGPVFYQVMRFALQTLKIPPDGGKRPIVPLTVP